MAKFTKFLPFIVLTIALASLFLQYKAYEAASGGCGCQDKAFDDGSGPVID